MVPIALACLMEYIITHDMSCLAMPFQIFAIVFYSRRLAGSLPNNPVQTSAGHSDISKNYLTRSTRYTPASSWGL
ncbi:hypothetical protein BJX63DRAFT_399150 [Aspergillus granulosus]|uniref:Uncharacterized protein n=1 Tax=Aspergillus granulosus TaxID=176169 RepID=A0ABR4H8E3_9EURO